MATPGTICPPPTRRRRTAWREFIRQVCGADPLQCSLCTGRLRLIAVVETKADILAILTPLGLACLCDARRQARPHQRPFAHGPPRPEVTVLVAADSGAAYPVDPPRCEPRLPYPRPRDEPLGYRVKNSPVDCESAGGLVRHIVTAAIDARIPSSTRPVPADFPIFCPQTCVIDAVRGTRRRRDPPMAWGRGGALDS